MKRARLIEFLIGIVFLVAAAGKAVDLSAFTLQVMLYGVVQEPQALTIVAYAAVVVEALLGALLIGGIWMGGIPLMSAAAMLIGFSGLVAYAWAVHGLTDCGCFGSFISMGPGATIAKNAIMLGMLGIGAYSRWQSKRMNLPVTPSKRAAKISKGIAFAGLAVVAAALALGKKPEATKSIVGTAEKPFGVFSFDFEGKHYDLTQGEYVVAMLSATCEHCQASVAVLNEAIALPEYPQLVAVVLGNEEEYREFEELTLPMFPTGRTDNALAFAKLQVSKNYAPPSFHFVRDGVSVKASGAMDPTLDDLKDIVPNPAAPGG
ncbi:MAG: hypothetical protein AMXMBFR84_14930 [Candidatus Hydrogenedentota bacterium]